MEKTIAAISTAMSASGIGIIRISGPEAIEVIARVYRSKGGKKKIKEMPTHTIHYGYIYDEEELIDEVLVMLMRAPRTFTGEDTVEIDCHGGVYACRRVLETVLKNGAKIAEPGEFTKRAFLNGRLDLSQAEAVMDVIEAKNEYALKSSMEQLRGSLKKAVTEIRSDLIYHIAYIESALDDPEHISLDGYAQKLLEVVEKSCKEIYYLVDSSSDGKIIQEGIRTVILGKPNAGKSSLLNLLVGENRAIVTDIAGTTRDILEEYINLHGITLRMIDTAGIRETEDIVEKIGVAKARETAKEADLILYVVDSSTALDQNDEEIISMIQDRKAIVLYNKTDLQAAIDLEELKKHAGHPVIPISAKEETGVRELEEKIKDMFFGGNLTFNDQVYITNARHKEALNEAYESLSLVKNSIEMGMPEDFFSIDLMNAYESLGRILGESVGEDLVNEIFSKFCMGK
jgi:tRNA modification GTPase